MKYILLDANIYLHCQMFDSLPWREVLEIDEPFAILLPMQVLREIDGVKDRGQGVINKRARKVSARLGEYLLENKPSPVQIVTCEAPAKADYMPGFSAEVSDDVILMSAIRYVEGHGGELIIVSKDVSLLLKAKQARQKFVKMPEQYSLSMSNSEEDRSRRALEEELRKLKSRVPAPRVAFEDGSNLIRLKRCINREPVVDPNLPKEEQELCYYKEMEVIGRERFACLSVHVFNDGSAPTGTLSIHLDAHKLKTCRIDLDIVHIDIPPSLMTEAEKEKDWGYCDPYRSFEVYERLDNWPNDPECDLEYEPLTQKMNHWIRDFVLDLVEAESGSIDWIIYDPALPDSVKGTLYVEVE